MAEKGVPSAYSHLDEEGYAVAKKREQLYAMLNCSPWQWIPFLKEHADAYRMMLNPEDKAMFNRKAHASLAMCKNWKRGVDMPDGSEYALLREVFGEYTRYEVRNEQGDEMKALREYSDTDSIYARCGSRVNRDALDYLKECTYDHFWNWMHSDEGERVIRAMDPDDIDYLTFAVVPYVVAHNHNLSQRMRFHQDGDEEEFERIIASARGDSA